MPEIKKGYSLNHAYKYFKENNKHRSGGYSKITRKEYRSICKDFNSMLVDDAATGRAPKLPHSMGMIWIKKFKMNWSNPPVDLNKTKIAKNKDPDSPLIYHLNDHSDGWCGRWTWNKRNSVITNIIYYSLKMTYTNKQRVAFEFKKEGGYKKFFVQQMM